MTQPIPDPIPDPNPIDDPEVQDEILGRDEFSETTGEEDDAWEEDDAQWGQEDDPLKHPEDADARQLADDENLMVEPSPDPELADSEVQAMIDDPKADEEVNDSLEDTGYDSSNPMVDES